MLNVSTILRIKLNGGRLKVVYHQGLTIEECIKLEKEWPLARTLEDLRAIFRQAAERTGQTCSMMLESVKINPLRLVRFQR